MKKSNNISKFFILSALASVVLLHSACRKDLLNQQPRTELNQSTFWKTEADAVYAINGLYAAVRPCFDRDYFMEGHGEYTRVRGSAVTNGNLRLGDAYQGAGYGPSGYGNWDKMYRYLFGAVNRANYVIENSKKMIASGLGNPTNIEVIIGEARFLRALSYFKLISMWGDVPYFTFEVVGNADVATLPRIPIGQVRDSILADLQFAFEKMPVKAAALGRHGKPAVLALRGKLNLYWGTWKKNGWPELEGFKQDAAEAATAFKAAATDFKSVINDYGLTLYMNGDPGNIDALGKADILPNYYHLFTPKANGNPEGLIVFTHGGTGSAQGEELMRDFSGRSHEGSQCWVSPRYEIADRYQSLTTGDFLPPMVIANQNPATNPAARTTPNSAVNPQSYANRDYRMKATIQWDFEMSIGLAALQSTGMVPFIFNSWAANVNIGGVNYITYNTDGTNSGYVFRKFVRNYPGQGRSDGDFAWPVIRLADVFLMYAEATNETDGPIADAIAQVNKVRCRGNLPPLGPTAIATKQSFFDAIEQERIVELIGEGQRGFDIRRWRKLETIWGGVGGPGVWRMDTNGAQRERFWQNASDRAFGQAYIFRIPESERNINPNLTQNIPWR